MRGWQIAEIDHPHDASPFYHDDPTVLGWGQNQVGSGESEQIIEQRVECAEIAYGFNTTTGIPNVETLGEVGIASWMREVVRLGYFEPLTIDDYATAPRLADTAARKRAYIELNAHKRVAYISLLTSWEGGVNDSAINFHAAETERDQPLRLDVPDFPAGTYLTLYVVNAVDAPGASAAGRFGARADDFLYRQRFRMLTRAREISESLLDNDKTLSDQVRRSLGNLHSRFLTVLDRPVGSDLDANLMRVGIQPVVSTLKVWVRLLNREIEAVEREAQGQDDQIHTANFLLRQLPSRSAPAVGDILRYAGELWDVLEADPTDTDYYEIVGGFVRPRALTASIIN